MTPEQEAVLREIRARLAAVEAQPETPVALEPAPSGIRDTGSFGGNALNSGKQFISDLTYPIRHPINTAQGLSRLVTDPDARQAVADFYKDRYGSWDAIKKTAYEDPFGLAGDASILLTGGGGALVKGTQLAGKTGKIASTAGKVGEVLGAAGKYVDPVRGAVEGGKKLGGLAAIPLTGIPGTVLTGTGGRPIREAAKAGFETTTADTLLGAPKNPGAGRAFLDQYTGAKPASDLVEQAKTGVNKLSEASRGRYAAGKRGMLTTTGGKPLDTTSILKSLDEGDDVGKFDPGNGLPKEELLTPQNAQLRDRLRSDVEEWVSRSPNHVTAEGLDALKRKIGAYLNHIPFENGAGRAIVGKTYHAIWKKIEEAYPQYADMMRDSEKARELVLEIEKSLSIGKGKPPEQTIRKLMGIFSGNAATGHRMGLVELLEETGAKNLMAALSGRAMHEWMPHGLGKLVMGGHAVGQGVLHSLSSLLDPTYLASIPAQMPRVVGGAAFGAGALAGGLNRLPGKRGLRALYQTRSTREGE